MPYLCGVVPLSNLSLMSQQTSFNTPFWALFTANVQTRVNSQSVNTALVKLTFAISAMRMFCNGITPHRGFRLKDYKDFYGLKGNKYSVLEQMITLKQTAVEFEDYSSRKNNG
jgi:hypothetical protein